MIKIVLFLGNPGKKYTYTRHNMGFLLAQFIEKNHGLQWIEKFKGHYSPYKTESGSIHFLKPLTFMNKSGEAARKIADFFKVPEKEILVVHDDLEKDLGYAKIQKGGGLGGHNGLRSIKEHLGSTDFYRLKLGISRPKKMSVENWVLSSFTAYEETLLTQALESAYNLLLQFLTNKEEK